MAVSGLYVYGIIRGDHPLPLEARGVGAPGAPVRLLRAGELAAVISEAPEGLRARRRDLMAHQDLLLALAQNGPVLPMRFGVVSPDEETVMAGVASAQTQHLSALERVEGRLEMNIKALPAQDSLASVVREDAQVRRLREEVRRRPGYEANVRLGEAVSAAMSRRAAEAAEQALRQLGVLASEVRRGPDVAGCALNASFLLERADGDRFREAAETFAADHRERVELRLTGPLPCYSFVPPEPVTAGA